MRFLFVFIFFFGVNLLGKNIEEGLKYLEIPNSKRQILKEAIRELYKQRQNYHSNDVSLEYKILKEIANKGYGEVNFIEYKQMLEKNNQNYAEAKINFYRTIGQILGKEEITSLMEFIRE